MTKLLSKPGPAVVVAVVATWIVLVESLQQIPWAPYFIVYGVVCVVLPLACQHADPAAPLFAVRPVWAVLKRHAAAVAAVVLGTVVWDVGVVAWAFEWAVRQAGLDPQNNLLDPAVARLLHTASQHHGMTKDAAFGLFAAFVLLWAPVGEELFYRGYLFGALRPRWGFAAAAAVSSLLFAVRHMTHFAYLLPEVPWGAAVQWAVATLGFGLLQSWLLERTRSLGVLMVVHAAVNVVEVALSPP